MTLQMILDSIAAWNSLRSQQNATQINALFNVGNYFNFINSTPKSEELGAKKTAYMHAYMGVTDNKLKIFLIDSRRDTNAQYESTEGILPYITVCSLHDESGNVGGEIPREEALLRIEAWVDDHEEWIGDQVLTTDNIFQAFAIPEGDLASDEAVKIYFALKPNPDADQPLADLIVVEKTAGASKQVVYYDMVRPVPPFGAVGPYSQSNFYLLEIS